jgi:protein transport protein SEC31
MLHRGQIGAERGPAQRVLDLLRGQRHRHARHRFDRGARGPQAPAAPPPDPAARSARPPTPAPPRRPAGRATPPVSGARRQRPRPLAHGDRIGPVAHLRPHRAPRRGKGRALGACLLPPLGRARQRARHVRQARPDPPPPAARRQQDRIGPPAARLDHRGDPSPPCSPRHGPRPRRSPPPARGNRHRTTPGRPGTAIGSASEDRPRRSRLSAHGPWSAHGRAHGPRGNARGSGHAHRPRPPARKARSPAHLRPQPRQHVGQHVIVADQQVIARHLAGRVAVPDMPGQPRQIAGDPSSGSGAATISTSAPSSASSASPASSDTVSADRPSRRGPRPPSAACGAGTGPRNRAPDAPPPGPPTGPPDAPLPRCKSFEVTSKMGSPRGRRAGPAGGARSDGEQVSEHDRGDVGARNPHLLQRGIGQPSRCTARPAAMPERCREPSPWPSMQKYASNRVPSDGE